MTPLTNIPSGTAANPTVVEGGTYMGGYLGDGSSHILIRGATFTGGTLDIMGGGENVTFERCRFSGHRLLANVNGIDKPRYGTRFIGCEFEDCENGIYFGKHYHQSLVSDCSFRLAQDKAIYAGEDTDSTNVCEYNRFDGTACQSAVLVWRAGGIVRGNVVIGGPLGIAIGVHTSKRRPTGVVEDNMVVYGDGRCIAYSIAGTEGLVLRRNFAGWARNPSMVPRVLESIRNDDGQANDGLRAGEWRVHLWSDGKANHDPLQPVFDYAQAPGWTDIGGSRVTLDGAGYLVRGA